MRRLRVKAGLVRWQAATFMIAGLIVMYLGQLQLYHGRLDLPVSGGWVFLLVGLGMTLFGLHGITLRDPDPLPLLPMAGAATAPPVRLRLAWLALALVLGAFTGWRSTLMPPEAYLGEHVLIWSLSLFALWRAIAPAPSDPRRADDQPIRSQEWALILSLLIVAFAMRGLDLERNPAIFDHDEANFAIEGASLRANYSFLTSPYSSGIFGFRAGYQILAGLSTGIFGETATGARMPAAILGTLGVLAAYLLGRELFGWRGGLIAALFMISWPFHLQFSRLALNQAGDPLFATLAFYFLVRGMRTRIPLDFALSGTALGLSQLFYLGGVFSMAVMLAYLGFIAVRRPRFLVGEWRLLAVLVLALVIVTLPLNIHIAHFQQAFFTRGEATILGSGQLQQAIESDRLGSYLFDQFKFASLALFYYGDLGGWYGRSSNLVGITGGPLLLLGAAISLLTLFRFPRWSLPFGWSLAIVAAAALSVSPPHYQRYFPGVAALALVIALGAMGVAKGLAWAFNAPRTEGYILTGIGILLFAANTLFYYGVYVPEMRYLDSPVTRVANLVAQEMLAADRAGRQIALVEEYATGVENTVLIRYLMFGRPYLPMNDLAFNQLDPAQPLTVIVPASRRDYLAALRERFPDGRMRTVIRPDEGALVFYVFERG
jgi:4-amino-4-deoxy-L-arabinose transferase-like glycosyltransferase